MGVDVYTLLRTRRWSEFLPPEAPAFGASFLIAELAYKFHSFTLECLAFLATWYVLGWASHLIAARLPSRTAT